MIETKKKKFREKIGQIFQIPLSNGKFGYCQMASKTKHAFFNYFDDGNDTNIDKLIFSDVLFYITIDSYIFKEEMWKFMGAYKVIKEFIRKDQFSYNSTKCTYIIWRVVDGILKQIPARPEEIKNLESFSSWNERYARERLEDYFAGRPNYCVEHAKNRHDPNFPGIVEFYKKYGYDYKLDKN